LTLAVAAACWAGAAWWLARTSVPALHLSGLDEHRYFSDQALRRSTRFSRGEELLWVGETLATLAALGVLAWRLPRTVATMGLGRIGSAIIVGMVLLTTLWAVGLPFAFAALWWEHHWGLGPFDVLAWLNAQWAGLGAEAVSVMLAIVVLVGLAGRFRYWWAIAAAIFVGIAALFALTSGWLSAAGTDGTYLGTVFGPMLIAGLATGLAFMPITATVLAGVEPEHAGSASGLLQTTQQLGSAVGVAVIVSVYAAGAVPGQFVPGLQPALLTSAGFAALALVVAATVLRTPRAQVEPLVTDPELVAEAA